MVEIKFLFVSTFISLISVFLYLRKKLFVFLFLSIIFIVPIFIQYFRLESIISYYKYFMVFSLFIFIVIANFDLKRNDGNINYGIFDRYDLIASVVVALFVTFLMKILY